jgi:hypothetical protein
MRPTIFLYLFITAFATLLPDAGFAEDRYECLLRCSAEQDLRDTACYPIDAPPTTSDAQAQCEKKNMALYIRCFRSCPPSQIRPASAIQPASSVRPSDNLCNGPTVSCSGTNPVIVEH